MSSIVHAVLHHSSGALLFTWCSIVHLVLHVHRQDQSKMVKKQSCLGSTSVCCCEGRDPSALECNTDYSLLVILNMPFYSQVFLDNLQCKYIRSKNMFISQYCVNSSSSQICEIVQYSENTLFTKINRWKCEGIRNLHPEGCNGLVLGFSYSSDFITVRLDSFS